MTSFIRRKISVPAKYLTLIGFLSLVTSSCQTVRRDTEGVSNVSAEADIENGQAIWDEVSGKWSVKCRDGRLHDGKSSALVDAVDLGTVCEGLSEKGIDRTEVKTVGEARFVGLLEHGNLQTGGESTGTIVRVGDVAIELDLSVNAHYPEKARRWNGSVVQLQGKLQRTARVTGELRWILQPNEFSFYEGVPGGELQLAILGTVTHGSAIGGEATGHFIDIDGVKLELGLTQSLRNVAANLKRDEKVVVIGNLTRKSGVEIKERWIVQVNQIDTNKDLLRSLRSRKRTLNTSNYED